MSCPRKHTVYLTRQFQEAYSICGKAVGLGLMFYYDLTNTIDILHFVVSSYIYIYIYIVSLEEGTKLRESVPYVKIYRYNPKHLYPKLNGYGDNGQRSLKL